MALTPDQVAKFVGPGWAEELTPLFNSTLTRKMVTLLKQERAKHEVFPSNDDVFNAFKATTYSGTRVVIVGQDPYHTPGMAHGLSFSVPEGNSTPPSLRNIFKELEDDVGFSDPAPSTDLTRWADQGVLLLNTALTVRKGEAGSHSDLWRPWTRKVLEIIATRFYPTIFVGWGAHAQGVIEPVLDPFFHGYVQSPHPSPFSARRGFFGSKPFSKINSMLEDMDEKPIDWT